MIELALRMGRIMGPPNRLRGALTRLIFYSLNIWPPAKAYFAQMKYKPKPRFKDGFLVPDQRRRARDTPVGRLLPQPDITLANGRVVKLDEVLGDGFALVGLRQSVADFEGLTRHNVWRELGVRRVLLQPDGGQAGDHGSVCIAIIPPSVFGDLDRGAEGVVLFVRPDRYVAAAFSMAEADIYAEKIKDLCAQTWPRDVPQVSRSKKEVELDVVSP
jgi:3-(3-hydroxy-phenyl)propionate hydroxylase